MFNAQLVTSIDVQDQIEDGEDEFVFNKSIDLEGRRSFGNVLRENNDIYNQTVHKSIRSKHNRVLTDSITGYGPDRLSLQASSKPSTHKKSHKSNLLQQQFNQ